MHTLVKRAKSFERRTDCTDVQMPTYAAIAKDKQPQNISEIGQNSNCGGARGVAPLQGAKPWLEERFWQSIGVL